MCITMLGYALKLTFPLIVISPPFMALASQTRLTHSLILLSLMGHKFHEGRAKEGHSHLPRCGTLMLFSSEQLVVNFACVSLCKRFTEGVESSISAST